jgi:cysteine desulfurase
MPYIYLDNASTTKIDPLVLKEMQKYYKHSYANASSIHLSGQKNSQALEKSQQSIAKNINIDNNRLIFTSGASESNNYILKGVMQANAKKGKHLIVSAFEHPSVLQTAKSLEKQGYLVDYLKPNNKGTIEEKELKRKLRKDTVLVSIMMVNNEIGTISDIKRLAQICHKNASYFHSDITQAINYLDINIEDLKIDFASFSAHKIHGPLGIGVAIINPNIAISPLIIGGEQENGKRAGTYNLPAIVGLAKALEIAIKERGKRTKYVKELRNFLWQEIKKNISTVSVNGCLKKRVANNLNVLFKNIEGEAILMDLSSQGIEVSTGSACSAHNLKSSYVLSSIGLKDENLNSNIRFSLSHLNNKEEIKQTVKSLKNTVKRLRSFSPIK